MDIFHSDGEITTTFIIPLFVEKQRHFENFKIIYYELHIFVNLFWNLLRINLMASTRTLVNEFYKGKYKKQIRANTLLKITRKSFVYGN